MPTGLRFLRLLFCQQTQNDFSLGLAEAPVLKMLPEQPQILSMNEGIHWGPLLLAVNR
jgi:hypothetical protein